jgi:hypothetical protein
MVARCAAPDASPESIVATLWRDAALLRAFTPGGSTMVEAVAALPGAPVFAPQPHGLEAGLRLREAVVAAIPDDLKPASDEAGLDEAYERFVTPAWDGFQRPMARYLAAKAFANWTAYQGRDILAIVRGLDAALALVRIEAARRCRDAGTTLDAASLREAIRAADFALNHLAVGEELAEGWSRTAEL